VWDVPNDLVRIGTGSWMKVHGDEPLVKVRRIVATEDITIPARRQVAVNAHLLHNAWSCRAPPALYGVMESQPVSTREHVYSGRTLLSTQKTELQVPILNARMQDVVLQKGTLLGKVFAAKIETQDAPPCVRRLRAGETISPAHAEVIQKMMDGLPSELTEEQRRRVRQFGTIPDHSFHRRPRCGKNSVGRAHYRHGRPPTRTATAEATTLSASGDHR